MISQTNKLSIQNISKSFVTAQGKREILKNVSFDLEQGQFMIIGGENGSGKSLLMNIIAGLESADSGTVTTFGKIGLVFQEAETQILGETPEEDISFGPQNLGWTQEQIQQAVNSALEKTGLTAKKNLPARFFSGGEKRRLAIACMLSMNLPILILDEPYANLDYQGVKQVNNLLSQLKKQGHTIILLTHEIEKCLGLADRFLVLFRGEKVFDETPEKIQNVNIEQWNIKNPFSKYNTIQDLIW